MKFYTSWRTADLFLFSDLVFLCEYADERDVICYEDFIELDETENPSLRMEDMKITDDSRGTVKRECEVIHEYIEVKHVKTLYWKAIKHMVLSFPFDKCAENFHELLNYLYNWFQQKKDKN